MFKQQLITSKRISALRIIMNSKINKKKKFKISNWKKLKIFYQQKNLNKFHCYKYKSIYYQKMNN